MIPLDDSTDRLLAGLAMFVAEALTVAFVREHGRSPSGAELSAASVAFIAPVRGNRSGKAEMLPADLAAIARRAADLIDPPAAGGGA